MCDVMCLSWCVDVCTHVRMNTPVQCTIGSVWCGVCMLYAVVVVVCACVCECVRVYKQGNLFIMETLGPDKQFAIQRFPLFRGYA